MKNVTRSRILMIGGRDFQIKALESLDVPYSIIQKPDELTDYCTRAANDIYVFDYSNLKHTLRIAQALHDIHQFDAVLAYREYAQIVAAEISRKLNIPTNCNYQAVSLSRDKTKMRDKLSEAGLNNVNYQQITELDYLKDFYHKSSGKIILKPCDGVGSQGVCLIESLEDCQNAFVHANSFGASILIAEEYIGGEEFSVEAHSKSGHHSIIALTRKITSGAPHFVEKGHDQPAQLNKLLTEKIEEKISGLLDTIGHENGPTHTEIKVYNDDVFIIETHIRIGGDSISDLTRLSTGFDMFEETIAHFINCDVKRKDHLQSASIRFFTPDSGVIESIEGVESAENTLGVKELVINVTAGDRVKKLTESYNRVGYVITGDESIDGAKKIADECLGKVRFNIQSEMIAQ